jgi:hypothetical protein
LNKYLEFCESFRLTPLPISEHVFSLFTEFLHQKKLKSSTIKTILAGVKSALRRDGFMVPKEQFETVRLALLGIQKTEDKAIHRMSPITPVILQGMYHSTNVNSKSQAALWSMTLTCFYLLLRKSQVCVDQEEEWDKLIKTSDVRKATDGSFTISVFSTKTSRSKTAEIKFPLLPIPNSTLCPVTALESHLKLNNPNPLAPLFSDRFSKPITYKIFSSFIKEKVAKAGYNPSNFNTHSLRRGGATHAFKSGIPEPLIQAMGDWRSDCYKVYLTNSFDTRRNMARKVVESITSLSL